MDGSNHSSDSGFEVHEVIFAESLGVNLQEEFALELLDIATRALYILPEGWEVDFADSDLGSIPFFYDTTTEQSHWVHPYSQDLKMLIEEKRLELLRGEDMFDEEDEVEDEEFFEDAEDISNTRVNESFEIEALPPRVKPAIDGIDEEKEDAERTLTPEKQQSIPTTEDISEQVEVVLPEPEKLDSIEVSNVAEKQDTAVSEEEKQPEPVEGQLQQEAEETTAVTPEKDTIILQPEVSATILPVESDSVKSAGDSSAVTNKDGVESELPPATLDEIPANLNDDAVIEEKEPEAVESVKIVEESPVVPVVAVIEEIPPTVVTVAEPVAEPVEEEREVVQETPATATEEEPAVVATSEAFPVEAEKTLDSSAPAIEEAPVDENTETAVAEPLMVTTASTPPKNLSTKSSSPAQVSPASLSPAKQTEEVVEEAVQLAEVPVAVVAEEEKVVDEEPALVSEPVLQEQVQQAEEDTPVPVESQSEPEPALVVEAQEPVAEEAASVASSVVQDDNDNVSIVSSITEANPVSLQDSIVSVAPLVIETPQKPVEEKEKTPTPKSARPPPSDPFADFFSIDPSLHTFIDNLEKKKKKKLAKQAKSGNTPTKKDDDDTLSVDLDEILRQRRKEERAKEQLRLAKEKEINDKKKAQEEEMLLKKEQEERLKAEKEAELLKKKQQQEEAEAQKAAAEAAEKEKAAAAVISVPAVAALEPPPASVVAKKLQFEEENENDPLSLTTKSLLDDLVAGESVPEEENEDNRLSYGHKPSTADQWGLQAPLTPIPLDKSVDIMDHFRNIYSAPSAADNNNSHNSSSNNIDPTNKRLLRQPSSRYVPGVAAEHHALAASPATTAAMQKPRGLDTTKLITRDASHSKKKKKKNDSTNNNNNSSPTTTSPPVSMKPHPTTADGWVILAAYANYKEAERAVALFEAVAPTKSIAGQSFPTHTKHLPPVKSTISTTAAEEDTNSGLSPLKKKSLLLSNAPITKESILLSTQQELPQVRIARDLGRMQWVVECNDSNMKKVFERRIAKRLRHGQGAEKLLSHLSPSKQQALGLGDDNNKHGNDDFEGQGNNGANNGPVSPLKHIGKKFTAPFIPQALISNKNTKHVSGQMQVLYALPRAGYDDKQQQRKNGVSTLSLSTDLSAASGKHHNNHSSPTRSSNNQDGASSHRGPLTFRAVVQEHRASSPPTSAAAHESPLKTKKNASQRHPASNTRPASTHL